MVMEGVAQGEMVASTLTIRQLPLADSMGAMGDWCRLELNDPPTSAGGIRGGAMTDLCRLEQREFV